MGNDSQNAEQEEFHPKGAIAFFVILIIMYMVMWFSLYFELIGRS